MGFPFVKMQGAGNDFILIDDRHETFPCVPRVIARLASRCTGIGGDGVILVRPSRRLDFRMTFFNSDGSEAEMCGNGARCVAAFAREIGAAKASAMRFETRAGTVGAEVISPRLVKIEMPEPRDLRPNFINSGVPHCLVPVEDLAKTDVLGEGRRIRFSEEFAPAGTNVDFVVYHAPHHAEIRTYERGVEAETGACGTGAVAAALIGVAQYNLSFPVRLRTVSGDELTVEGVFDGRQFQNIALTGPIERIFAGEIDSDWLDSVLK